MAKNKPSKTPHYEMLYIISNKFSENELEPVMDKVEKTIEKLEGKITYKEFWGKKKMTYPIKHFTHGYYSLVEFDLNPEKSAELDRTFKIMPELLRHLIVKSDVYTTPEMKQEKEKAYKASKESGAATTTTKREEKEVPKKVEAPKLNPKDLDDKLDEILKAGDLL